MLTFIFNLLFGCRCRNSLSFPITRHVNGKRRTYRVCLGCGKETPYDWDLLGRIA